MKKDIRRNSASEEKKSIENNQRQMNCQPKEEYERRKSSNIVKTNYLKRKQPVEKILWMIKGLWTKKTFLNYGSKDILLKIAKAVQKKNLDKTAVMESLKYF